MPETRRLSTRALSLYRVKVTEDEVPWDDIAFASVRFGLEAWFEDRRLGRPRLHMTAFHP